MDVFQKLVLATGGQKGGPSPAARTPPPVGLQASPHTAGGVKISGRNVILDLGRSLKGAHQPLPSSDSSSVPTSSPAVAAAAPGNPVNRLASPLGNPQIPVHHHVLSPPSLRSSPQQLPAGTVNRPYAAVDVTTQEDKQRAELAAHTVSWKKFISAVDEAATKNDKKSSERAPNSGSGTAFPCAPPRNASTPTPPPPPPGAGRAVSPSLVLGIRTASPADIAALNTANDYLLRTYEEDLQPAPPPPIDNLGATTPIIRTLPPLRRNGNGVARLIIVGDVHGCVDQLVALLNHVHFNKAQDRLLLVGDLVNKGPDSVGVIRLCQEMEALAVLGNHDMTLLDLCAAHRKKPFTDADLEDPVKRLAITFPANCEQYLRRLPHIVKIPEFQLVVVHAGIDPRKPLEEQSVYNVLHMRRITDPPRNPTTKGGKQVIDPEGVVIKGEVGVLWGSMYKGPETIIFGHAARNQYQQHPYAVGIDTGCVYGIGLTCTVYCETGPKGHLTGVPGLPTGANAAKGLLPPEDAAYEQHFMLPAEAVQRSIARPTAASSQCSFHYDPNAMEGSRCTPASVPPRDGMHLPQVIPFPAATMHSRNASPTGGAAAASLYSSTSILQSPLDQACRPPPAMTPMSLAAALENVGRDMNSARPTTSPSLVRTAAHLAAAAAPGRAQPAFPPHQKRLIMATLLRLVDNQEFSAVASLVELPDYDHGIEALTADACDEVREMAQRTVWEQLRTLVLGLLSVREGEASSGQTKARNALEPVIADTLLSLAVQLCESCPSLLEDEPTKRAVEALLLPSPGGLSVSKGVQKLAKLLLKSEPHLLFRPTSSTSSTPNGAGRMQNRNGNPVQVKREINEDMTPHTHTHGPLPENRYLNASSFPSLDITQARHACSRHLPQSEANTGVRNLYTLSTASTLHAHLFALIPAPHRVYSNSTPKTPFRINRTFPLRPDCSTRLYHLLPTPVLLRHAALYSSSSVMLQVSNAFPLSPRGELGPIAPLLAPQERLAGVAIASCRQDSCIVRYFSDADPTEAAVIADISPPSAEGYTVWAIPGATTPSAQVALLYFTCAEDRDANGLSLAHHVRRFALRVQTAAGSDLPLHSSLGSPLILEDVKEVQVVYANPLVTLLVVRCAGAAHIFQLPPPDTAEAKAVFGLDKNPHVDAVPLRAVGETLEVSGSRRSATLLEYRSCLEAGDALLHMVLAVLDGRRLHVQLVGLFGDPLALQLRSLAGTPEGGLPLPDSLPIATVDLWTVDWTCGELVLRLGPQWKAGPTRLQLVRLQLGLAAGPASSDGAPHRIAMDSWLLPSASPPAYANAATRDALAYADDVRFASVADGGSPRSVWALQADGRPGEEGEALLLRAKDVASPRLEEYHMSARQARDGSEMFLAATVTHRASGGYWAEELFVLLGSTAFRLPALRSAAPRGTDEAEKTSLCGQLLAQHTATSTPHPPAQLAASVSALLRGKPAPHLPPVIRDTLLMSPDGSEHAVLDTLVKGGDAAAPACLLRYLSAAATLHPSTVVRSLLFAGERQGLLLAVGAVVAQHPEIMAAAEGPGALPGWRAAAEAVYKAQLRPGGHATQCIAVDRLLSLWAHAAALGEAAVTAAALGSHLSLVVLLETLAAAATALYTQTRATTLPGYAVPLLHAAEARLQQALRTLGGLSDWCSSSGSVFGNLTAHLPSPAVAAPRRKEAEIRPGIAKPVQTKREIDIVPLMIEPK
eukprot:gene8552-5998_t